MEKLEAENRPKTVCGDSPIGLRRWLSKQSVCDLFLTERVICNPYALERDEKKRLRGHRKCPIGIFPPYAQLAIPDQVTKNSVFASKARLFPAWMRNGPSCRFDSILNTNSSFWGWMKPKMFLNCTHFANKSQINLLVLDEDIEDSEIIYSTAKAFTDQIVQNHCFLEEGSENSLMKGSCIAMYMFLNQTVRIKNYVRTTSHVFGTHHQHTELRDLNIFTRDSETDL